MIVSVIVPVADREAWRAGRASLDEALANCGSAEWEVVEVFDDARRGVAAARNEGLARAKGDWICWIDADDEVTGSWAKDIAAALCAAPGDVDIVVFDYEENGVPRRWPRPAGRVGHERFLADLAADGALKSMLWNKAFRRCAFAGLRFDESLAVFEDYELMTRLAPRLRDAIHLPRIVYRHRFAPGSLTCGGDARSRDRIWIHLADARFRAARGAVKLSAAIGCLRARYHFARAGR